MTRGRSAEVAQALGVLRRAVRSRRGGLVTVVGPAGIGKSAFARAVGEAGRSLGFRVGQSQSGPEAHAVAGGALLTALRSGPVPLLGADDFAQLAPLHDRPVWMVDLIAEQLVRVATGVPLLVTIDDADAADALSRFALKVLPARLGAVPIVWLLTSGTLSTEVVDEIAGAAGQATRITLGRLDVDAGDHAIVRRRLAVLSPAAGDLVRLAAVWGRPLPMADAATLLDSPGRGWLAEAAREACAGGVLLRDGETLAVQARDSVYAQIAPDVRRSWHERCGNLLLDRPGAEQAAAGHLRAAGDRKSARRVVRAAGVRANAGLALCAWELVADLPEPPRDVVEKAIEVLVATERHTDVVAIADAMGPGEPHWQLIAVRALVASGLYDEAARRLDPLPPDANEALRAAIAAGGGPRSTLDEIKIEDGEDIVTRRLAARTRAMVARRMSRFGDAWHAVADVPVAPTPVSTAERVRALQDIDRFDEAAALLEAVGAGATVTADLAHLGPSVLPTGDLAHLGPSVLPTGDLAHLGPSVLLAAARQELDLGRLTAAAARAQELAAHARETRVPVHRVAADAVLAEVALHRGDPLDLAAADLPTSPVVEWSSGLRILHAAAIEDGDAAVRLIMPTVTAFRAGYCSSQWSPAWTRILLAVVLRSGHRPSALHVVEDAEHVARHNDRVASWVGTAKHAAAVLSGDAAMLGEAVEILRTGPRPLLLARALVDHAALVASQDAIVLLEEAAEIYTRCGAGSDAKAVSKALQKLGVRRRRDAPAGNRPVAGWWSLTDSEQLVAQLIGAGHTNRSAAAELGVSPNTVATHLRSVFAKLAVRSRVQLANVLRDRV
ncbi:LuxR C-terminal-related transcriptional regulator [Winogradskya humida]